MSGPQIALAPPLLFEQLGVANRERGLGRECLDQARRLFREIAGLVAGYDQAAEDALFVQKRGGDQRAITQAGEGVPQGGNSALPFAEQVAHLGRRADHGRRADRAVPEANGFPLEPLTSSSSAPWLVRKRNSRAASS